MNDWLRVRRTHYPVTSLGYGERLGIWVQGCPLACPGCMSQETWSTDGGASMSVAELTASVAAAMDRGADGLTVSGGEPLEQAAALTELLRRVDDARCGRPPFDIMVYTGYELGELTEPQRTAAAIADVLVTGRYRVVEPTGLTWRGSANQTLRLQT